MENDRPGETGTDSKVVPDFDENDPETEVTTDIPAETGINSTVIPDFVPGFIPEKNSTTVTVIAKDNSTTPTPAPAVETESCYNTLKGLSNNFLSQGEIVLRLSATLVKTITISVDSETVPRTKHSGITWRPF